MTLTKIALLLGGSSLVAAAAGSALFACSSSTQAPVTVPDAGTDAGRDAGSVVVPDAGGTMDTGSMPSTDSGAGSPDAAACEKPPTLHPESVPGVYCPFSGANGGSSITCMAGEHCCETPESANTPSTCEARGTACPVPGSTDWECEAPIDCGGDAGSICCGGGSPSPLTACGVTWTEYPGFTGSHCVTSCPAPGFAICEANADCVAADAGTTCAPSKEMGGQVGFCMQ